MRKIWINLDPDKVDISYLEEHFKGKYNFVAEAAKSKKQDDILALAHDADAVISTLEPWDKEILGKVKGKLKLIQKYGMGLDNIDVKEASKNGIAVANIIGANSAPVAEVALLHILNLGRHFVPCVNGVRQGCWPSTRTGTELDGKTVGLMGFGNIARNLSRMLSGFKVSILAYDPYVKDVKQDPAVTFVSSPEALFEKSDIVSLHIPCTDETRGSINRNLFQRMKKNSYLVNTCRGGVINEQDLIDALKNGPLAAAGLDVLTDEPPKADNPLLSMDNVYVSSHMGAESFESGLRSQKVMAEAIDTFFSGGVPKFICNLAELKKLS